MKINCDHICHERGLNPWVYECPTCGCPNVAYDANVPVPRTIEELIEFQKKSAGVSGE